MVQPILGLFHHLDFRRTKKRGILGHIHTWYGRSIMILGVINGGLGIQLYNDSHNYIIGYSVAAGLAFLLYTSSIVFGLFKKNKKV